LKDGWGARARPRSWGSWGRWRVNSRLTGVAAPGPPMRREHGKATCRPVGAGGAQAGLLADGSSSIGAFPRPWGRSGDLPISSPLTVAGAASVLHRLPSFAAGTRCPDSTKRSRGLSKNRAPCRSRFRYCQPAAFLTCYMVLCRIIARDRARDGVILELRS
jgi:hypothetical protein